MQIRATNLKYYATTNMKRHHDYDDRRGRPLTGLGPESRGTRDRGNRNAGTYEYNKPHVRTLSLEEAVARHKSPPRKLPARRNFADFNDRFRDGCLRDRDGSRFTESEMASQEAIAACENYEQPMDPKTFREECRKAYLEATAQRQRNAEMSVWGRCNWATYDQFDDRVGRRR